MIRNRKQVEMVIYESEILTRLSTANKSIYSDLIGEISTDLMWGQNDDILKHDEGGTFIVIPVNRSVSELIEVIDEIISEYDLEDYF